MISTSDAAIWLLAAICSTFCVGCDMFDILRRLRYVRDLVVGSEMFAISSRPKKCINVFFCRMEIFIDIHHISGEMTRKTNTKKSTRKSTRNQPKNRRTRNAEEMEKYRTYLKQKYNKRADEYATSKSHIKECAIQLQMMAEHYRRSHEPDMVKAYTDLAKKILASKNIYHVLMDTRQIFLQKDLKGFLMSGYVVPAGYEFFDRDHKIAKKRLLG